jgi:hypothetical protein
MRAPALAVGYGALGFSIGSTFAAVRRSPGTAPDNVARLDAASYCYSIATTLDADAINSLPGSFVASLSPHRPFAIQQEVSLPSESRNSAPA